MGRFTGARRAEVAKRGAGEKGGEREKDGDKVPKAFEGWRKWGLGLLVEIV